MKVKLLLLLFATAFGTASLVVASQVESAGDAEDTEIPNCSASEDWSLESSGYPSNLLVPLYEVQKAEVSDLASGAEAEAISGIFDSRYEQSCKVANLEAQWQEQASILELYSAVSPLLDLETALRVKHNLYDESPLKAPQLLK